MRGCVESWWSRNLQESWPHIFGPEVSCSAYSQIFHSLLAIASISLNAVAIYIYMYGLACVRCIREALMTECSYLSDEKYWGTMMGYVCAMETELHHISNPSASCSSAAESRAWFLEITSSIFTTFDLLASGDPFYYCTTAASLSPTESLWTLSLCSPHTQLCGLFMIFWTVTRRLKLKFLFFKRNRYSLGDHHAGIFQI